MTVNNNSTEQINVALLNLENQIKALKSQLGSGGLTPGQTYDINISGNAATANNADYATNANHAASADSASFGHADTADYATLAGSTSTASTANALTTARNINGTAFDGSTSITTDQWGTARNVSISDADATNTGAAVSVNGSGDATLKLPSTIKADLTGNASTATSAGHATTADSATTATTADYATNADHAATADYATSTLLTAIWPVGSLYWSSSNINPTSYFGGTWVRIKDTFIYAAGDNDTVTPADPNVATTTTAQAGKKSVVAADLPKHRHSISVSGTTGNDSPDHTHNFYANNGSANGVSYKLGGTGTGVREAGTKATNGASTKHTHSFSYTGNTGYDTSNDSMSIMPPYKAYYCWEKISDSDPE